jgi:hypothetical protein
MKKEEAEEYAGAMRHVKKNVYARKQGAGDRKTDSEKKRWWQFVRPRADMRAAIDDMKHVLVISSVGPHLLISRQPGHICFDHQLMVVALNKPFHFGLFQSKVHAIWARARGSTFKGDPRYTNTTVFETLPFPRQADGRYDPRKPPQTPAAERVSEAAEEFERARSDACRAKNQGPTKIHNLLEAGELKDLTRAYDALNDAVTACYGFPKDTWRNEDETLRRLLTLNHEATGSEPN